MNSTKVEIQQELLLKVLKHNKLVNDDDEHYILPIEIEAELHELCDTDTSELESDEFRHHKNRLLRP